jgi:putative tryptophan/tyrosine transport system substrate-binding protein
MRRRAFITLVGGAVVSWPRGGWAQQSGKLPTIGLLVSSTPADESQRIAAFTQRLHQLGWIDGRTVAIALRAAESRPERVSDIAAEFVRLNVDIIATSGTQIVAALKQATSTIPIVFAVAGDPVGNGLVASLARPGGNVTGLSLLQAETAGKRLELLREVVPGLRRLAIMGNFSNLPIGLELDEVKEMTGKIGLELTSHDIRRPEDIALAFEALKGRAQALYVIPDALIIPNRTRIIILAVGARLPTIFNSREYVKEGALLSYGPNFPDLFRRAADYVDKILRGAKPADLPVEQPIKFDLVVNLVTARALGLTVPPTLLARADEVIE